VGYLPPTRLLRRDAVRFLNHDSRVRKSSRFFSSSRFFALPFANGPHASLFVDEPPATLGGRNDQVLKTIIIARTAFARWNQKKNVDDDYLDSAIAVTYLKRIQTAACSDSTKAVMNEYSLMC